MFPSPVLQPASAAATATAIIELFITHLSC
jgi:hypothetical protein